jgi:hypothetical protein
MAVSLGGDATSLTTTPTSSPRHAQRPVTLAKDTMQGVGDRIILQLPELGPELTMSDHQQIQMHLPELAVFITLKLSKSA